MISPMVKKRDAGSHLFQTQLTWRFYNRYRFNFTLTEIISSGDFEEEQQIQERRKKCGQIRELERPVSFLLNLEL